MNWMRSFSIRLRMRGAIAMVLALFGLVGATALLGGRHMAELNETFMEHSVHEVATVGRIRDTVSRVQNLEKSALIHVADSAAVARDHEQWLSALGATATALRAMTEGEADEDNAIAEAGLKQLEAYSSTAKPLFDQLKAGGVSDVASADGQLAPAREHLVKLAQGVDQIEKIVLAEAEETRAAFGESMHNTMLGFIAVLCVVVAVVVPLTLMNSGAITGPVDHARRVAMAIADGHLTQHIDVQGKDETADLLRALAHMQSALSGLVGQVRQASENIHTASNEVASGNTDLSHRTEQAASNLQMTASSVDQLTGSVRQSADAATHASELATSASAVAVRGGEAVSAVVTTMDEINQASRRIGDIISVIDGIAFQTNILALNAAVEAARAGEQGRGFAVVAGEVRSLAGRSAEAAREIKTLINASVEKVDSGSRQVQDAGATMNEIVASVQRVTDIIREITAASVEQSQGIGQVNSAVGELDRMTQQNAALVEQSAAAAESLKDQATLLNGLVSRFRIEDAMAR